MCTFSFVKKSENTKYLLCKDDCGSNRLEITYLRDSCLEQECAPLAEVARHWMRLSPVTSTHLFFCLL